jgi:hypothetical protein
MHRKARDDCGSNAIISHVRNSWKQAVLAHTFICDRKNDCLMGCDQLAFMLVQVTESHVRILVLKPDKVAQRSLCARLTRDYTTKGYSLRIKCRIGRKSFVRKVTSALNLMILGCWSWCVTFVRLSYSRDGHSIISISISFDFLWF